MPAQGVIGDGDANTVLPGMAYIWCVLYNPRLAICSPLVAVRVPSLLPASDGAQAAAEAAAERKQARREARAAPDTLPPLADPAAEGARAINTAIEKNRGLTPHRSKAGKNPRKKNRTKFEKAVTARKGQVRRHWPFSKADTVVSGVCNNMLMEIAMHLCEMVRGFVTHPLSPLSYRNLGPGVKLEEREYLTHV